MNLPKNSTRDLAPEAWLDECFPAGHGEGMNQGKPENCKAALETIFYKGSRESLACDETR